MNQFRSPDAMISSTGYPTSRVFQMLWQHLNNLEATHALIVLDEIDSIGTDDNLYKLPRANDNDHVDNTLIGAIGISNDFTFKNNLSAWVKDSLCDEELHFPPYDANQLRHILTQWAEKAFRSDVLDDDVIPLAAFAAQESGSARQALKLLYKAGDLARSQERDEVQEQHVQEAQDVIERSKVQDELEQLPTQSQLTLYSRWLLDWENKTPCKRNTIYDRYTKVAEAVDADVVTDRTIHDRISPLQFKGFLEYDERNEGLHGGSYLSDLFDWLRRSNRPPARSLRSTL